jgi:isoquinoline 1-oxidoreductase beta subunit
MSTRRKFILGTIAAVGALTIGWGLMPVRQRLMPSALPTVAPGQLAFNGWVSLGTDGTVTVLMSKSEMGQGIHTGLAMLLADELDADWSKVRTGYTGIDPIYNNIASLVDGLPFHPGDEGSVKRFAGWMTAKAMREFGVMMTGGSSSMKDLWMPMRQAGASARAMLVGAAADLWGVPAGEITVASGQLSHASGRKAGFGELVQAAAKRPIPTDVKLKDASAFTLIGKPLHRLDGPVKSDGRAGFGIDVVRPGMLYASVLMCPTLGGKVKSFDAGKATGLKGVKKVLEVAGRHGGTGGVAVIADHAWRAMKALEQVQVTWDHGAAAGVSSADVFARLAAALDSGKGHAFTTVGDADGAMAVAVRKLSAEYRAPYLAHAALEPMNCTVQVSDGRATAWVSTQVPDLARRAVAKATGLTSDKVDIQVQYLGGGFGRRLDVDCIGQAAQIAMAADGAPVQTLWSREQDMTHDFYRPATMARFEAGLDAQGRLLAWRNLSAGQAIVPAVLDRLFDLPAGGPDKTTSEGAFDQPYEFAAARIAHVATVEPVPVGFWRSVGHSHQAFFKECFMDEVAGFAGQDPMAFRAGLLQRHPRHLKVLQRAAELGGWGSPLPIDSEGGKRGRGIALHESFGSIVAQVAEVTVSRDKQIRVDRVVCVIDCGYPVNPNLIRQQAESSVVFALSAALHGEITIDKGQVKQSNFHDYTVLRMSDAPVVETEIIASTAGPEGVGEPMVPPVAAAVANAVFVATGQRLRSLPLKLA